MGPFPLGGSLGWAYYFLGWCVRLESTSSTWQFSQRLFSGVVAGEGVVAGGVLGLGFYFPFLR